MAEKILPSIEKGEPISSLEAVETNATTPVSERVEIPRGSDGAVISQEVEQLREQITTAEALDSTTQLPIVELSAAIRELIDGQTDPAKALEALLLHHRTDAIATNPFDVNKFAESL